MSESQPPLPFFHKYLAMVAEHDVAAAMRQQLDADIAELRRIVPEDLHVPHGQYTWTIADVINHMADAERVFSYRAMRFARGDATPLPSFDENDYAIAALANRRHLTSLVDEFAAVRRSSLSLFESLTPEAWQRRGRASTYEIDVATIARLVVGHARHHLQIVHRRLGW